MSPSTRAAAYIRVSTDVQERDGTSLDTQERGCHDYASNNGWDLVATFRESASGATLDRPEMNRLRSMVRSGELDVIVAHAVDRLSRGQNHVGVLWDEAERHGVRIVTVAESFEDSSAGRFLLGARAFMAELEREKIAERTMRGKRERARGGRLPQGTGRGLYGYHLIERSGRRDVNQEQAEIVRRMFTEFASGASTLGIANTLNADGIPTFTGKRWSSATIYYMLRNETYTGRAIYGKTKATSVIDPQTSTKRRRIERRPEHEWIAVEGSTPPIVDGDTFAFVQSLLDDPERRRRGRPKYQYKLSGHVRCGRCGAAMTGQTLNGGRYRYYRCRRTYEAPTSIAAMGSTSAPMDLSRRCSTPSLRFSPTHSSLPRRLAAAGTN